MDPFIVNRFIINHFEFAGDKLVLNIAHGVGATAGLEGIEVGDIEFVSLTTPIEYLLVMFYFKSSPTKNKVRKGRGGELWKRSEL